MKTSVEQLRYIAKYADDVRETFTKRRIAQDRIRDEALAEDIGEDEVFVAETWNAVVDLIELRRKRGPMTIVWDDGKPVYPEDEPTAIQACRQVLLWNSAENEESRSRYFSGMIAASKDALEEYDKAASWGEVDSRLKVGYSNEEKSSGKEENGREVSAANEEGRQEADSQVGEENSVGQGSGVGSQ